MIKLIDKNQKEIRVLCERFSVKKLEIFGSAAEKNFTSQSDLDFLVEFQPLSPVEHKDAYFGLLDSLRDLFNRSIDLLETEAIDNPYFLESINRHRVQLYAA